MFPQVRALFLGAALIAAAGPAFAPDKSTTGTPDGDLKSAKVHDPEMHEAMQKMHRDMMKANTGDPDKDFAIMMIPHHQGAISMARAELAHGDDPWAKELALKVITAQEQEIADMLEWLSQQSN